MGVIILKPSAGEIHLAANVGVLRQMYALRENLPDTQAMGFGPHIEGALGELALAKHLGVFWSGTIGTIKAPGDVAYYYQVRATSHPLGKLIMRHRDKDDQPFVLARVLLPEVHLVGWLWGGDAKQDKFLHTDNARPPAFFAWPVNDMDTLPSEDEVDWRQKQAAAKIFPVDRVAL